MAAQAEQTAPAADEGALVVAARRGEAPAWQALLALHGPTVYALCVRLDPEPEDAYQEIWEKVHRHLGGFDPAGEGALGAWVRTVARRHLIDRHRRRQVRGEVLDRIEPAAPSDAVAEQAIETQEQQARLEAALRNLPPGQRRAVVLHHLEGLALEEIAASEAAALGTIKSRLHRARAHLARLLGGTP